jgi:putative Ca2+/H+ antiporter (TMEM165/GDT1 family)
MAFSKACAFGETDDKSPAAELSGVACCFGFTAGLTKVFMDTNAFFASTSLVAIAEIGDKTQLLSLVLAARYRQPVAIILGILVATLLNHALAAYAGHAVGTALIDSELFRYGLSALFIGMGIWALVPDTLDDTYRQPSNRMGAFLTSCICFFVAEMGDKTQLATIALGARYNATLWVIAGTTLGMLLANIPAVLCGDALLKRIPLRYVRLIAAALFITFGVWGMLRP